MRTYSPLPHCLSIHPTANRLIPHSTPTSYRLTLLSLPPTCALSCPHHSHVCSHHPTLPQDKDGNTAMHHAAMCDKREMAQYLLTHLGAELNPRVRGGRGARAEDEGLGVRTLGAGLESVLLRNDCC